MVVNNFGIFKWLVCKLGLWSFKVIKRDEGKKKSRGYLKVNVIKIMLGWSFYGRIGDKLFGWGIFRWFCSLG